MVAVGIFSVGTVVGAAVTGGASLPATAALASAGGGLPAAAGATIATLGGPVGWLVVGTTVTKKTKN